jgi:hypothetical protein
MSATPAIPSRVTDLADWVAAVTAAIPGALAAHAGGSISTGRLDAWSDLDVSVHTEAGATDAVYSVLLRRLGEDWQVSGLWDLATPTWHGGRQFFAEVTRDGADPVILDLVAMAVPDGGVVVDPRRHGIPVVLHDPDAAIRVADEDDATLATAALSAARTIADRMFVARWIVEKSVAREQWPEAHAFYLTFCLTATVQLLRTIHCPSRWDYGLRYLDTDLPADVRRRVEALLPGGSRGLGELAAEAFAWQEELLLQVLGPEA